MPLSTKWTRSEIRTAVQRELMDTNTRWWGTGELNSYIEGWQDIVQHEHEMKWGTATTTTTNSIITVSAVATDVMRVDSVYWNNIRMVPRSVLEMDSLNLDWRDANLGTPGVVIPLDADRFMLWPHPDELGTLYMEYPLLLTFAADTSTMDLPAWSRYSAIPYVAYRCYVRPGHNNNLRKALRYKRMFESSLAEIGSLRNQYFPSRYPVLRPASQYEYDVLLARRGAYGTSTGGAGVPVISFTNHYDEVPAGTVNGTNSLFTLTFNPDPDVSLKFWVDGVLYTQTTNYTLSGTTVTVLSSYIPIAGQTVFATYRYIS